MSVPAGRFLKLFGNFFCPLFTHRGIDWQVARSRLSPIPELVVGEPFLQESDRKFALLLEQVEFG